MGKREMKNPDRKYNLSLGRRIIALALVAMMALDPMAMARNARAEGEIVDITKGGVTIGTSIDKLGLGNEMDTGLGNGKIEVSSKLENKLDIIKAPAVDSAYADGCGAFEVVMPADDGPFDLVLKLTRSKTSKPNTLTEAVAVGAIVNGSEQTISFAAAHPWAELTATITDVNAGSTVKFDNIPVRDVSAFVYYDATSIQVTGTSHSGATIAAPNTSLVESALTSVTAVAGATGDVGYEAGCGHYQLTMPENDGNANSNYTAILTITAKTATSDANLSYELAFDAVIGEKTGKIKFETNPYNAKEIVATISNLKSGEALLVQNIQASGYFNYIPDCTEINVKAELFSNDTGEKITLDPSGVEAIVAGETVEVVATSTGASAQGWNPFRMLGDDGSLMYLLNNYNVVSKDDLVASHIIGPVIAQRSAYKVDGADLVTPRIEGFSIADYTRGIPTYIGVPVAKGTNESFVSIAFSYDLAHASFAEGEGPDFYMRKTLLDGTTLIKEDGAQTYKITDSTYPGIGSVSFPSPLEPSTVNAHYQKTHQGDHYIDFDDVYVKLSAESTELMENGRLSGSVEVIETGAHDTTRFNAATGTLTLDGGKSYRITDSTGIDVIDLDMPDGYDFFGNHCPIPTIISFEETEVNGTAMPADAVEVIGKNRISQLPATYINGAPVDTPNQAGGEFDELGNKIVWNFPNLEGAITPNMTKNIRNIAGHIVAPKAEFWNINSNGDHEGGNLNGTGIFADFHSGIMESHLFSYDGSMQKFAEVALEAEKAFNGTLAGDDFEFQLTTADGKLPDGVASSAELPITVKNDINGKVTFPSLTFNKVGIYTFFVSEIAGEDTHITYDPTQYTVTIEIEQVQETVLGIAHTTYKVKSMTITKDGTSAEEMVFTNTLIAADHVTAELDVTKKFQNQIGGELELTEGQFDFKLAINELNPTDGLVTTGFPKTVTNDAAGKVKFGALEFSKAGTYTFDVQEVIPAEADKIPGVTYDETVHTVTITVTDNSDNTLSAVVTYANDATGIVFTNTKADATHATAKLEATKKFLDENDTLLNLTADQFRFKLSINTLNPADGLVTENLPMIVTNDADGKVKFGELKFSKAGTYTFDVQEVIPADENKIPGVTYDETVHTVTITVTDNGDNTLSAVVTYADDATGIVFTNTKADATHATAEVEATKKFLDENGAEVTLEGGEFEFELSAAESNPDGLVTTGLPKKVTNDADGKVKFGELEFSMAGTYTFTVKETKGDNAAISYDTAVYTVTIVVADDGDNELIATVTYKKGGTDKNEIVFTNKKVAATHTTATVVAKKNFLDENGDKVTLVGGEFTFELIKGTLSPADGLVTTGLPMTAKNDASGNVTFGSLEFSKAGTYTFTVKEVAGTDPAISYDDTVYTVTITVTKNSDNILSAEVAYAKGEDSVDGAVFTNQKIAATPANATITAKKDFEDQNGTALDMTEGQFAFELSAADGNPEGLETALPMTAENNASGIVTFASLKFTKEGEYTFYVKEVIPTDANKVPGMTYDDATHTVTITVTKENNVLSAEVVYRNVTTGIVFTNTLKKEADVILDKMNEYGQAVVNAVFDVVRVVSKNDHTALNASNENAFSKENITSNAAGEVVIEKVPFEAGYYKITEQKVPNGYVMPANVDYWLLEVDVDETGKNLTQTLYAVTVNDDTAKDYAIVGVTAMKNLSEYTLPNTGGLGTMSYLAIGLLLTGSAGGLQLKNKKRKGWMENEKDDA